MERSSRMENLHAPTVPSGPTTALLNGSDTRGMSFAQLQAKKDNIEAEIRALGSVLESHGVDMNTSLLTPDGFPRADIDVAQSTTPRFQGGYVSDTLQFERQDPRIIYLKNDYKALMTVIEKHIHEHFARLAETGGADESTTNGATPSPAAPALRAPQASGPPFAKVNTVVPGSPAESAGLKAGDLIRNFGYVNIGNHDNLRRVGECVQGNEGQNVIVKVSRPTVGAHERRELELTLTPRRDWEVEAFWDAISYPCEKHHTSSLVEIISSVGVPWKEFGSKYKCFTRTE